MTKEVVDFRPNLAQKMACSAAMFCAFPFFVLFILYSFLLFTDSSDLEFADRVLNISIIVLTIMIPVWAISWHVLDLKSRSKNKYFPNSKYWYLGTTIAKWTLAGILFFYAFAKVFDHQLTASPLWYGKELGEMTGFMITWAFFGYSKTYSLFIAFSQILGGSFLIFNKTLRLGIIILIPILVNILVIDFTYDGLESPRDVVIVLLYITLFLFFEDYRNFKAFFWPSKGSENKADFSAHTATGKNRVAIIPLVLLLLYGLIPNYLNKLQAEYSPLEGVWYSSVVLNYNDSLQKFKNDKNQVKLFVNDDFAIIKSLGKETEYQMLLDLPENGDIQFISNSPTNNDSIIGKYTIPNEQNLQIKGVKGSDSIRWTFRKWYK